MKSLLLCLKKSIVKGAAWNYIYDIILLFYKIFTLFDPDNATPVSFFSDFFAYDAAKQYELPLVC